MIGGIVENQIVKEDEALPDILELMKIANISQDDVDKSVEKWKKSIKKGDKEYTEFSNILDES